MLVEYLRRILDCKEVALDAQLHGLEAPVIFRIPVVNNILVGGWIRVALAVEADIELCLLAGICECAVVPFQLDIVHIVHLVPLGELADLGRCALDLDRCLIVENLRLDDARILDLGGIQIVSDGNILGGLGQTGVHLEGNLDCAGVVVVADIQTERLYPVTGTALIIRAGSLFLGREVLGNCHFIGAVVLIHRCAGAYECGIVVDGNLILAPVVGAVAVGILVVRTACECAPEDVLLLTRILCHRQTGACTVVRVHDGILRIIAAEEDSLAVGAVSAGEHGLLFSLLVGDVVVTEDVVDLALCGLAPLTRLAVVVVLVVNCTDQRKCGCIAAASPNIDEYHALLGGLLLEGLEDLADAVIVPEIIEDVLILALCVADLLHHVKLRMLLVDDSPEDGSTAPDVVPAVYPAGCCVVVEDLVCLIEYGSVAGRTVHPCSSPAVIILPLAGGVELSGAVAVVGELLLVVVGEFPECLCVVEGLFRILRIGVLEVEVVDGERCACRYDIIRLRLFCREEVCRTHHGIHLGRLPYSMVNAALTDLVAVCDHRAVLVAEGTLHEVIIEVAENRLDVVILTELGVGIAELVIAPAECCSGVVFRHTELYVVTGIVHTAGNVDRAVAVRVQNILVLVHELLRQVGAAALHGIAVPRNHGNVCVVGVAVVTPRETGVLADLCAAHIGVIEVDRILQRTSIVDFNAGVLDRGVCCDDTQVRQQGCGNQCSACHRSRNAAADRMLHTFFLLLMCRKCSSRQNRKRFRYLCTYYIAKFGNCQ